MSEVIFERAADVPLVWIRVAIRGGTSIDPAGTEGLARHAALLARRGAGARARAEFDAELDGLGASLGVSARRDAIELSGVCLSRNLDRFVELFADLLARPRMDEVEHQKQLRETRAALLEVRDDDAALAERFFARYVAPGHPYARTSVGTAATLSSISLEAARDLVRRRTVASAVEVGVAGDIDRAAAQAVRDRLLSGLASGPTPELADVHRDLGARGRRLYVIDKPERLQCQVLMGHTTPAYASPDTDALSIIETAFGGMFTSRLMQEVRARRGWSYDAGCSVGHARGPHWLRISMSPTPEHLAGALALVTGMYESLAAEGIDGDELDFCRDYLTGSVPFGLATAEQRMRAVVRSRIAEVPDDHSRTLPRRLAALTMEDVDRARAHLRPADLLTVVVASADEVIKELEGLGLGDPVVVPYSSY